MMSDNVVMCASLLLDLKLSCSYCSESVCRNYIYIFELAGAREETTHVLVSTSSLKESTILYSRREFNLEDWPRFSMIMGARGEA
jgi:hypothetical protein